MKTLNEKLKGTLKLEQIRINGMGLFVSSMIYIYISIIIFLIGWLKPIISIPTTVILLVFLYKYIKEKSKKIKETEPIYISVKMLILVIILVCGLGWVLGWTGHYKQSGDWEKHNGVLIDLTEKSWPVYYENDGENSMLTYYLGQYMVPAVIGKICSSVKITQLFNGIWAMVGLFISVLGIFKITKSDNTSKQLKALLVIIGFSTCLPLSQVLGKLFIDDTIVQGHWFMLNDEFKLAFSNNIILLRWVMPQTLIAWIVLTILYEDPYDIKNYVLLCLPVLFYSSLSFIGLIIFLVVLAIIYMIKTKDIKEILKNVFSLSNIFIVLTLGIILLIYFSGNLLVEKPDVVDIKFINYGLADINIYIFFVISVIPYTIALFKKNKGNIFYWVSTTLLIALPWLRMGLYNDLLIRASIAPLFIYMIMSIDGLIDKESDLETKRVLIVILLIGGLSSNLEMTKAINGASLEFTVKQEYSLEKNANRHLDISEDLIYNYYTYDLEDSLFYNYLARAKMERK